MKKNLGLIIFILVIIVLIIVAVVFSDSDDKYLKEISISDSVEKINNDDTFILYVKQKSCEHCKEFYPTFIDVLREYKLEAYSIDIGDLNEEDSKLYSDNFDVKGTPTVLFYQNGDLSLITIEGAQTKERVISKLEATEFIK